MGQRIDDLQPSADLIGGPQRSRLITYTSDGPTVVTPGQTIQLGEASLAGWLRAGVEWSLDASSATFELRTPRGSVVVTSTGVAPPGAVTPIPIQTDRVLVFVTNTGAVDIGEPWFQIYLTGIDNLRPGGPW